MAKNPTILEEKKRVRLKTMTDIVDDTLKTIQVSDDNTILVDTRGFIQA